MLNFSYVNVKEIYWCCYLIIFVSKFILMKIFTFVFIALAIVIIGFNISMLNFNDLLKGDSLIGIISIMAMLCAVIMLLIFRLSQSIEQKINN